MLEVYPFDIDIGQFKVMLNLSAQVKSQARVNRRNGAERTRDADVGRGTPPANAGALSHDELALLRTVSPSQGMMVESLRVRVQ